MVTLLEHLYEITQSFSHSLSAVVLYDERHLHLGVLLQLVELPRVEVCYEVAVFVDYPTHHPVIKTLRQVMQREPEQREADKRCY